MFIVANIICQLQGKRTPNFYVGFRHTMTANFHLQARKLELPDKLTKAYRRIFVYWVY